MNLKELFILQMRLDVKEGKEIVVAIDAGASLDCTGAGLRESATRWAGAHYPEQVKRKICDARVSGSKRARELRRHAVSGGHGVGYRTPAHREGNAQGLPNELTGSRPIVDGESRLSQRTFRVGKQSPVRQYIASCTTEADPDQPGQSATGSRRTARQPARSSQGSPFRLSFHSRQQPVAHRLQVDRYRARTGRDHRLSLKNCPMTL